MNKKLITAIMATVLSITAINMAKAEEPKPATVAILDTALNANLSVFKDRIVHEVCILEWNSCVNKSNFMEGPGAAAMPLQSQYANGFDHGTKMTHAAVLTNPNIKVVFVRIIGATSTGARQVANEATFVNALNWVIANKNRFNIQAVSLSQGHYNLGSLPNYCPNTPNTITAITGLANLGVPVFISAGNNRDLNKVTWPACIKESVTVSGSTTSDGPALYTNYDVNRTDFFALSRMKLMNADGYIFTEEGTSISAQVAAASYMKMLEKYPTYTSTQLLGLLSNTSKPLISKTLIGKVINLGA